MKRITKLLAAIMLAGAAMTAATSAMAQSKGAKIFVIGGKADDPFWSIVKRGAEDAGKVVEAQGGSVTWLGPQNYDNLGADAADLIRTAISQHADAIVGPDWVAGRHGGSATPSAFATQITAVFAKFKSQFTNITGGWNDAEGIPVTVTGVVFFDRPHGQTGRALNGLEIHPVLDINFNTTTPVVPVTPTSVSCEPTSRRRHRGPSAGVITNDPREPAHSGT